MSEFKKVNRCYHCGTILQSENPKEKGYINEQTVNKYPNGILLCNECYKNERYNIAPKNNEAFDSDFSRIIDVIKEKNALIVYVVDVFSFEGSFINSLNNQLEGIKILAVANKADLLPDNISAKVINQYIQNEFKKFNLNILDSILVSSNTGLNIEHLIDKILALANGKDVYFIGASESGKSAVINEILKNYDNKTNKMIATYTFKNTRLRGIKIPLNDNQYILETPGFLVSNSITSRLETSVVKKITPTEKIKMRKRGLSKNNAILFGGIAVIQLLSDQKFDCECYAADNLNFYSTILGKIDRVNIKLKYKTIEPRSSNLTSLTDFDCFDIEIDENNRRDIGILGLGWITFTGNKQVFRIFVPRGTYIYEGESKIKYVKREK